MKHQQDSNYRKCNKSSGIIFEKKKVRVREVNSERTSAKSHFTTLIRNIL